MYTSLMRTPLWAKSPIIARLERYTTMNQLLVASIPGQVDYRNARDFSLPLPDDYSVRTFRPLLRTQECTFELPNHLHYSLLVYYKILCYLHSRQEAAAISSLFQLGAECCFCTSTAPSLLFTRFDSGVPATATLSLPTRRADALCSPYVAHGRSL